MLNLKKYLKIILSVYLFFLYYSTVYSQIIFEDALDRKIVLKEPARRVAIVYNYVEYSAVAGKECYKRVVGIGKRAWFGWRKGIWNEYIKSCPEIEKITDIGLLRFGDFFLEKFLSINADILILPKWQYDNINTDLKANFKKAGIILIVTDYANQHLDTHIKSTLAMGYAIGKIDRAKEIIEFYKNQLNFINKNITTKPLVYIEKGQKGPDAIDDTWSKVVWGDMLETAGGKNIADNIIPAKTNGLLSKEYILQSNPGYIFITGSNWSNSDVSLVMGYNISKKESNKRLQAFTSRKGWKNIKAIKNNNLYAIHHGLARSLMDFSAIQFMAKKMHPKVFKNLMPESNLKLFHNKFLPVRYKGTWFF